MKGQAGRTNLKSFRLTSAEITDLNFLKNTFGLRSQADAISLSTRLLVLICTDFKRFDAAMRQQAADLVRDMTRHGSGSKSAFRLRLYDR